MNTTETPLELNIASRFTNIPGPRFKHEGKFSGEEFRDRILKPLFEQARQSGSGLLIDLDGGYGYAPSFLEEAFGGLAREYGREAVTKTLTFKSEEEPLLIRDINSYIAKAVN